MAQTAVDYLVKKFHDYGTLYYSDIEEAKAMEKEQIIEAAARSCQYMCYNDRRSAEHYYNETYNK